ncbi:hypothetical protein INS49_015753 [Diaporthe citri]|uniref:uncharacterized protein n=1 Tax=Diaporthe citri TaxID=83186 RepID=UPI001C80CA0F|nr:uncharacterized protein INS49_015753 [Diaporthe citri]KAG6356365.1 hypothetical protein INS49_015753 [Diaporthe citri]
MSPIAENLRSYFGSHQEQPPRPILTSLNGDGSWLMSFPLPPAELRQENGVGRKRFYHVVVDPWLRGPATMVSPWLVFIERTEPAAVSDGAGVEAVVHEIEELAAAARGEVFDADSDAQSQPPLVDAIFIKLHLLDHLHQPTLETFDKRIPVFATAQAAPTIHGWGHFDTVVETLDYKRYNGDGNSDKSDSTAAGVPTADRGSHWKTFHPGKPLPEWLSVFRLASDWEVELATALVWSHESQLNRPESGTAGGSGRNEFIINTPHGVDVNTESVEAFFDDNVGKNRNTAEGAGQPERADSMQCLAILAGFKDSYSFGMRQTVGVGRSLQLERKAEPRYWVRSHDLPLRFGGAVMRIRMTKEVIRTLEYGLEEETKARLEEGQVVGLRKPNLIKVGNGKCCAALTR